MFFCEKCNNSFEISYSDNEHRLKFICRSCSFEQNIDREIKLIDKAKKSNSIDYITSDTIINVNINSPIYPHTTNYLCENKECISNKNTELRDFVFFRLNNSYKTIYICCNCKQIC